jgi:xanthine dehydrogenase molybdopterin-binding subunit B
VFHALRDAIAMPDRPAPHLQAPATPEAVLRAITIADDSR